MTSRLVLLPAVLLSVAPLNSHYVADDELGIVRITAVLPDRAVSYFTGTHIGDGWILTCGHCCEALSRRVEVRILSEKTWIPIRTVQGVIVCHDHEADVGLIRLEQYHGLRTAYELAPRGYRLYPGDEVVAYDWRSNGKSEQLYSVVRRITGINLYVAPDNIETTGTPKDGASGGPLTMRKSGWIIGVTTAANLERPRGIHTGLEPIYRLFEHCQPTP